VALSVGSRRRDRAPDPAHLTDDVRHLDTCGIGGSHASPCFPHAEKPRSCTKCNPGDPPRRRSLRTHPELGRPIKEMPPQLRERFVAFGNSGYVVLYRYDGSQVVILAVRHGREAGY
jgi:hypothetical protein